MHPWNESRIKSERDLIKKYGLKNHKEVWKAKTDLGKHREQARELLAKIGTTNPQVKKESDQLLQHLTRMGILTTGASLDDVLALEIEAILSRRLQTLVYLKGFSSTPYQARQLICHGHIGVKGKKVTIPSYIVEKDEENQIDYTVRSPLNEISHPARPKGEMNKENIDIPQNAPVPEKQVVVPPKKEVVSTPVESKEQQASTASVTEQTSETSPTPTSDKQKDDKSEKIVSKPKVHPKKDEGA